MTRAILLMVPMMTALVAAAQDLMKIEEVRLCSFYGETIGEDLYGFEADRDAKDLLAEAMDHVGLAQASFEIAAGNVPTIAAVIHGGERLVLFDQLFIQKAVRDGGDRWVAVGILAHEAGHHLAAHDLPAGGPERQQQELEADRFSGLVLSRMGASLEEAQAAVNAREDYRPSASYPPREDRLTAIRKGWETGRVSYTSPPSPPEVPPEGVMPRFEWPPPRASATAKVPSSYLIPSGGLARLQDLADSLEAAFENAGYVERSYYAVPDGFAIVSRLEQIEENGEPKPDEARWSAKIEPQRVFSLRSYLRALLSSNPGRYRIVVFVVTSRAFTQSQSEVEFEAGRDWLWNGMNKLPPSIGILKLTDDYACTALIYEFEQSGADSEGILKTPSALTGRAHLERARLWKSIEKKR